MKGILGDYVLISKGEIKHLTDASEEVRMKSIGGISQDSLIALEGLSKEELLKINSGQDTILKLIGDYVESRDFYVESTFVDKELANQMKYPITEILYNKLKGLKVPTDNQYNILWG